MTKTFLAMMMLMMPVTKLWAAESDAKNSIKPIAPAELEWHKQLLARIKRGNMNVVFFGDSATVNWEKAGIETWNQRIEPLGAANFGVNSDQIGHLLWRLQNGELDGYRSKVVVVMIGHADIFHSTYTPAELAEGIMACVGEIRQRQPGATVLVMALAAAGPIWNDKQRATIVETNRLLAKECDGKQVRLIDATPKALERMEEIKKELAIVKDPHLLTIQYKIWADVLDEPLKQILGTRATSP